MAQISSVIFLFLINLNFSYAGMKDLRSNFEAGKYQEVISNSKKMSVNNLSSSDLNLVASSFFRLEKKKEAAFYFFLGLKKDPFNSELLYNFNLAAGESIDVTRDRSNQVLFVIIFIFLIFILFLFLIKPGLRGKKGATFIFSILLCVSSYIHYFSEDISQFILIKEKTDLKSGVDPEAFVFETLEKGEIFYIIDRFSDHLKVKAALSNKMGWIKK